MSQKNTPSKEKKKLLQAKHQLEAQINEPRKKGQPEPTFIKEAKHNLGKVKRNLSKK